MRSLTPVEVAVAVAVGASLLAATLPPFVRNLHASRLAEPIDGLNEIATRATALAAGQEASRAYPASVALTPAQVPRGEPATDPPGTWDHPTWRRLEFEWTVAHSFSFAFESEAADGRARFRALAHGDLDGDGVFSTFSIEGETKDGAEPITYPMNIHREVE